MVTYPIVLFKVCFPASSIELLYFVVFVVLGYNLWGV